MDIKLNINNIRNIKNTELEFNFESGINAIVGDNASGKSTIMMLLSLLVKPSSKELIKYYEVNDDSMVDISVNGSNDRWGFRKTTRTGKMIFDWIESSNKSVSTPANRIKGYYEASIFYGSRFMDYELAENYMKTENFKDGSDLITPAPFVRDTMSYILHGKKGVYENLKQIRRLNIAQKHQFRGKPYFLEVDDSHMISQFNMSSGESMLLSLVDFINSYVVQGGKHSGVMDLLFIIDEVEISLHPSAVDRLITFFENTIEENKNKFNIIAVFATHSAEVINRLKPQNIYMIENNGGVVSTLNPCYPNYAVRKLYIPNGYDFLILVEDELAKTFVDKLIRDLNISSNKLKCTIPAGGFRQVLKLHSDIINNNIIGTGKKVISVLDGDVIEEIARDERYKILPKLFLPIKSIEKFLLEVLVQDQDSVFTKMLGDKYFTIKTIDSIVEEYKISDVKWKSIYNNGKKLYLELLANIKQTGITEREFVVMLCDDILSFPSYSIEIEKFKINLVKMIS